MGDVILTMKGIDKSFPGVHALDHVDLEVRKGEVHALMGENGAGKSTLMKVLTGIYSKDSGTITFEGREVEFTNPREAQDAGIVIVHQELNMLGHLTVAQNIFIGREFMKGKFIDDRKMNEEARKLFDQLGIDIDPTETMSRLTVGKQQMCEIAKAISHDAKVIIFDEPLVNLDFHHKKSLIRLIKMLKAKYKKTIIIISNDSDLLYSLADDLIILAADTIVVSGRATDLFKSVELLKKYKIDVPDLVSFVTKARDKNVKLSYQKDILDLIKDVYKHV